MSSSDQISQLWGVAGGLLDQLRSVMAEAVDYWNEIAARFDDPLLDNSEIEPELKVDFVMAQVSLSQFFEHATQTLSTLNVLLEQGRVANETSNNLVATMKAAPAAMGLLALTIPLEDLQSLIADLKLLPEEREKILIHASNAIIAVATPWFFIRGAFAVYLNKPTLGANAFALASTLLKEGILHEAAKAIPFIGTIIAIAEMIKKQEERGYSDFLTFTKEYSAYVGLNKAVAQGLLDLEATDQALHEYTASIATINEPFVKRARRVVAFVEPITRRSLN